MAEVLETQEQFPVQAGIQEGLLKPLDSGFRRNDDKGENVLVQSFPNVGVTG
jgi:hypothetical protein